MRAPSVHGLPAGAASLERVAEVSGDEAERRLCSIRGSGVWTSAEVRQRALGDPDAVSFRDYHLANWVGWALVGHDITDEEMGELLEPYRPSAAARPRWRWPAVRHARGARPRMSIPAHLPTR